MLKYRSTQLDGDRPFCAVAPLKKQEIDGLTPTQLESVLLTTRLTSSRKNLFSKQGMNEACFDERYVHTDDLLVSLATTEEMSTYYTFGLEVASWRLVDKE